MADNAKWYVAHTYSGYENAVKTAIEKFVANRHLEDMILDIQIPLETVTEVTDSGDMKEVERKVFPDCKSGDWFYIAIQEATNSHTYERAATEKNGDEQWTALRANRDWTKLEQ